jgi:hypothetical protein
MNDSSEDQTPEKFSAVILDLIHDLNNTFPEYASLWINYHTGTSSEEWGMLYQYCLTVYPERFFDILYQDHKLFMDDNKDNTMFLPNVDFKLLYYALDVTSKTQDSIWKYLQLILFTIVGKVKDKSQFGNSAYLFDGIAEDDLVEKITNAMSGIEQFFVNADFKTDDEHEETSNTKTQNNNTERTNPDIPSPDDLHNHLKGLFGGKLGSMAKELMDELTADIEETLGINPNEFNENSKPIDLIKKLMRNPDKFMNLIKKIQGKFQDKMKSGDLTEDELMKEAADMLKKIKDMGGNSNDMHEMFKNITKNMGGVRGMGGGAGGMADMMESMAEMMGGGGGGGKTGNNDRASKLQSTKDRLRAKVEKSKLEQSKLEQSKLEVAKFTLENKSEGNFVYRPENGESAEKTRIADELLIKEIGDISSDKKTSKNNNKKKGKKNKNK